MSLFQTILTPTVTYEQPLGLYIDGKWVTGVEGKTFETINPATEQPIVSVYEAGAEGLLLFTNVIQTLLTVVS